MGREPICTCGFVSLWHGPVDNQNSQQIFDWYSFTHVLHGIGFYFLIFLVARRLPFPVRLLIAVFLEGTWEIAENSPFIIDRYRTATFLARLLRRQRDQFRVRCPGDDGSGFWDRPPLPGLGHGGVADRGGSDTWPWSIRDNLTLNIIMLIHPIDAIKQWQLGS